jgi:hypothetical protein
MTRRSVARPQGAATLASEEFIADYPPKSAPVLQMLPLAVPWPHLLIPTVEFERLCGCTGT